MTVDRSSQRYQKRRRFTTIDSMEAESAKAKLAVIKEQYGREIHVFETSGSSPTSTEVSNTDEPDDFYEFTAEDYYRLMGTKKQETFLKTQKIREMEEAARRSRFTKSTIRVRFPDNHTLEVTFHPSETIQGLIDLLKRVVARSDMPFYLYTTPPKKQLKDMSQDFYSAGFVPGAIVYFSYDVPKGDDAIAVSGPFLREEIVALKDLEVSAKQAETKHSEPEPEPAPANSTPFPVAPESKPAEKKTTKPKWFKM